MAKSATLIPLPEAQALATSLVDAMRPFCERVEIAGSIRREKESGVSDVEIIAIPRYETRPDADAVLKSLFEDWEATPWNTLFEWAVTTNRMGIQWIKTGTSEIVDWVPRADGKYWRGVLPGGAKLDLFLSTPEQWGTALLIRTGSWDFSREIMTFALRHTDYRFGKGGLCETFADGMEKDAVLVPTPEEEDVFRLLGLAFVPPKERTGPEAVRRISHA